MAVRGGKRFGAGRKPSSVKKSRVVMTVPDEFRAQIIEKFRKLLKAYEDKCKREQ